MFIVSALRLIPSDSGLGYRKKENDESEGTFTPSEIHGPSGVRPGSGFGTSRGPFPLESSLYHLLFLVEHFLSLHPSSVGPSRQRVTFTFLLWRVEDSSRHRRSQGRRGRSLDIGLELEGPVWTDPGTSKLHTDRQNTPVHTFS